MRSSSKISRIKLSYKKVPKTKKHLKTKHESHEFFTSRIESPMNMTSDEELKSSLKDRKKRFARDLDTWRQLHEEETDSMFPTFSKFHPEYGLMFNDIGRLIPGVKKTYLFMTVDIPTPDTLADINIELPNCADWAAANLLHWQGTEINPEPIRELIHQHVCREMNTAYRDILNGIVEDWEHLTHAIEQQIPAFLPNFIVQTSNGPRTIVAPNGKIWYSRKYLDKQTRKKRVAAAMIFAAVSAIGGLMAKGADVYNNWRRNEAMAKAMDTLIENDRRFHKHMLKLEDNFGLVTQTVATGFDKINLGFQTLNRSLERTTFTIESMLNLTERRFRKMHETLNNHHLALYYISKGISTLIPLMRKYRQSILRYRFMVKSFLDGLDELSTGRLCYEVLDPIMLDKYLRQIAYDLDRAHSNYRLAFQHTYQYYAEPLISFTNSPDYLIVQIPIFLVYQHQVPMTLFSTETVPVPYDAETYLGLQAQFTELQLNSTFFAVGSDQFTLISCTQLDLCIKLRTTYYCEQAYLLKSKEVPCCQAAIYFDMPTKQKVSSCHLEYTQNKPYSPQIIDTGHEFVLSNLPQPWILVCENSQRPFTIPYSTYRIINHTELCKCALSAGYDYQINKAQVQCPKGVSPDSDFVTYFAYNHAIMDILSYKFQVTLPQQLQENLNALTEDIPQYNLPDLQWYPIAENRMPNVYDTATAVVEVDLIDMLNDVTQEMKEQMYRSNDEFLMAQQNFVNYMADAEWWQHMQIWSAIIGALS